MVRGHVVNQSVKTWRIFHDQIVEGAGIALLSTGDQLLVFVLARFVHRLLFRLSISTGTGRQQIGDRAGRLTEPDRPYRDRWVHVLQLRSSQFRLSRTDINHSRFPTAAMKAAT